MTDNATPPIQVNPSPATDQTTDAIRNAVLIVSAVTALAGFVSKRDLAGFIVYVQSNEFIAVAATVISAATVAWSQYKARHRAQQLATVAADPRVPDEVAALR